MNHITSSDEPADYGHTDGRVVVGGAFGGGLKDQANTLCKPKPTIDLLPIMASPYSRLLAL